MKNTSTHAMTLRYQKLLLDKQQELVHGLKNHRLVGTLAPMEVFEGFEQRDIDLHRFSADADALKEISSALERLADAAFGLCNECGDRIPAKRLEAVPWARYCVGCQESLERQACERGVAPHGVIPSGRSSQAAA